MSCLNYHLYPLVPNHFQEKKQLFISLQYVYPSRDLIFCSQDSESSLDFDCSTEQGEINEALSNSYSTNMGDWRHVGGSNIGGIYDRDGRGREHRGETGGRGEAQKRAPGWLPSLITPGEPRPETAILMERHTKWNSWSGNSLTWTVISTPVCVETLARWWWAGSVTQLRHKGVLIKITLKHWSPGLLHFVIRWHGSASRSRRNVWMWVKEEEKNTLMVP